MTEANAILGKKHNFRQETSLDTRKRKVGVFTFITR